MDLLRPVEESEHFKNLMAAVAENRSAALFGAAPIHRAIYAAAAAHSTGRTVIFVTETDSAAVTAASDMRELGVKAESFASRDYVFLDVESVSHELEIMRLAVMGHICGNRLDVVCCSIEALCQFTMPKSSYLGLTTDVRAGETIDLHGLCEKLVSSGYSRTDRVDGRGQFAVRGGIIDVFPAQAEHPVRIELFGDEIDSINSFDEQSQRRLSKEDSVSITPVREVVAAELKDAISNLESLISENRNNSALCESARRDMDLLKSNVSPVSSDRYMFAFYDRPETIADYCKDPIYFFCEPQLLEKRHKNLLQLHGQELVSLCEQGIFPKRQHTFYLETTPLYSEHTAAVYADAFPRSSGGANLSALVNIRANEIPRWGGELAMLAEDIRSYTETGFSVAVLVGTDRAAMALIRDLGTAGFNASMLTDETLPPKGSVGVGVGSLSTGFELFEQKLCVISSRREKKVSKKRPKRRDNTAEISSLEDLKPGDYVVHSAHGIGVYQGIHRVDYHGFVRDYIKIAYRGSDTLFVPVTQLDMVSQYISPKEDGAVKLAKLNSGEWNKTKASVYRSVREMAKELIDLYAKRERETGISFGPDNDWQQDFESRFAYDETDDQLRAINEVKNDMQRARPMDRLLCGDVGVGKTEVALRAAFKCVNEGYQCAVLVPTTILAWQHFNTFSERMEAFPIKIAMLSRFSSQKDIREAVAGIKNGTVDIAIGTHRLLQKDIQFSKLGLLIVDEEQRFGVAHKEKLKQAFTGIDVLTLSATPIPRTLNMAMSGIRDMSVIEEPPEDRHPVQTFVMEYDSGVIGDAIKRELSRAGQVYYLHNRVETIELCASKLREEFPDARIDIAHGKMSEEQLSGVWRRFLNRESDILVCTTIIETGVDVPNCNTLIVENADRMGLSQLYQIRGRVGRSGRRAFAYFTFRRDMALSEIAQKRLAAIRDFTSFGSGFKIAMRDLQIRGAGSVLSARQSGHMQAVGYDTYIKILTRAVEDELGQTGGQAEQVECTVDLSVSAYIPESYIPDDESRIEMYKKISAVKGPEDFDDVVDELTDRFGNPPKCVVSLVQISLVRYLAQRLGIYEVRSRGQEALLLYSDDVSKIPVEPYIRKRIRRVLVSPGGKSHIAVEVKDKEGLADVAFEFIKEVSFLDN